MSEPVKSPLTGMLHQLEVAMWSRGVDPRQAQEVLNIFMFGHPDGSAAWHEDGARAWDGGNAALLREAAMVLERAGADGDAALARALRVRADGLRPAGKSVN